MTFLPLVAYTSSTPSRTARTRSRVIVAFFASTWVATVIFFFARNPCVLAQVCQPGRW
jgi:hypothetical protein